MSEDKDEVCTAAQSTSAGGFQWTRSENNIFLIPVRVISLLMQNKMRAKVLLVT